MNFFFLDNFLKIENTNLKFYNIADILIYNISVSSLLSVDIIDNILQITTKNNDVYKLEFMDNNQLLSAKQIILNIINGSTDYIGANGKYRDLSTYYTLSGFIDTVYSGNNILRLKDKSNISKYLLLMNAIRSTTVQNHILVISMYEKSIPLRFLTNDDAKNAKTTLDTYISGNMGPGGGSGSGVITNHSQLVLNDGTNPHGTTKSDIGLSNVDNTSDMNKPISISTQNALDDKVDKVPGMGLSQENFTTTLKDKLDGIEAGAEVNVQSDWNQTNNTIDNYIKNKPTKTSEFINDGSDATSFYVENDDLEERLKKEQTISTGFIEGLQLSIKPGDPTKAIIATGIYAITNHSDFDNIQVQLIQVTSPIEFTPQFLTTSPASYIALDINMQVVQSSSPFDNDDRRSLVLIGATIHSNLTIINVVNEIKAPIVAPTNQLHDLIEAVGSLNLEGNIYGPNGNNLQINKSAGMIWGLGINSQNYLDPHRLFIPTQTALTFRYRLRDTTLLNGESGDVSLIDPEHYDNSGVKTIVPNNRFTIQRINLFQSGLTRIQYGQYIYNSLDEAKTLVQTESFQTETNIVQRSIFRAYLIIKKGVTNLTTAVVNGDVDFIPVDKFGNVIGGAGVVLNFSNITTGLGYVPANIAGDTFTGDIFATNLSGTNTGDETTISIQSKRPLKTILSQSLEGIGDITITKNDIGLENVDNTSDINKPISTETQLALDNKIDKFIQVTGVTISTSGWTLNAGFYEYIYSNVNITSNSIVDVIPDNSSYSVVSSGQLLPRVDSFNGEIKIYSNNIPSGDFGVTIIINKN